MIDGAGYIGVGRIRNDGKLFIAWYERDGELNGFAVYTLHDSFYATGFFEFSDNPLGGYEDYFTIRYRK